MQLSLADLAGLGDWDGLGVTYQDLQALAAQVQQAASSAPSAAQQAVQAVMQRNTGFTTPGFGTVQGLVQRLATFNPPASFYGQDQQVLQQALTDIQAAVQQASQAALPQGYPTAPFRASGPMPNAGLGPAFPSTPGYYAPTAAQTGMDPTTMALIGAGGLLLVGLAYFMTRKPAAKKKRPMMMPYGYPAAPMPAPASPPAPVARNR